MEVPVAIHLRIKFADGCQVDVSPKGLSHVANTPPLFMADEGRFDTIHSLQKWLSDSELDFESGSW